MKLGKSKLVLVTIFLLMPEFYYQVSEATKVIHRSLYFIFWPLNFFDFVSLYLILNVILLYFLKKNVVQCKERKAFSMMMIVIIIATNVMLGILFTWAAQAMCWHQFWTELTFINLLVFSIVSIILFFFKYWWEQRFSE